MSNASRCRSAALAGLAALGIGAPQLSAIETVICNAVLQSDPQQAGAQFGWSVDADGTWLVGGAPFASPGGAIVVFEGPPTASQVKAPLPPPADLQPGDRFGFSVSIDGDWLAVGAPSGDGRFVDSGVVYIFRHEGGVWRQYGDKLEAEDAARDAQFGFSVALSGGNTLVVGAPQASQRGTRAGAAYVFALSDRVWRQSGPALLAADARPFDLFGSSVAVDGSTLVVGAPFADHLVELRNFGAAYVFERNQGAWTQTKLVAAGTFRGENIQFGASVALSVTPDRSRIVVGAPGDDISGPGSGSAFLFEKNATWDQFPLVIEDAGPGKQLGSSVDIDSNRAAVGARFDGEGGPEAGAAYLFGLRTRTEQAKLIQPTTGSTFGQSVALLDTTVYPGGPLYGNAGAIAVCPTGDDEQTVNVSISKTDGQDTVCPEEDLLYEITVRNEDSAGTAEDITVKDVFPTALTGVRWTCQPKDLCGSPSGSNPLSDTITLPAEGEVIYSVEATVARNARGTLINKAQLEFPDSVKNLGDSKAKDTDEILPPGADLEVKITLVSSELKPGDIAEYVVTVRNRGRGIAKKVKLTDRTTGGATRHDSAPSDCLPDSSDPFAFTCELGDILPGDSVTRMFHFEVVQGCPSPKNIVNIARAEIQDPGECDTSDFAEDGVTTPVAPAKADLKLESFEIIEGKGCPGSTLVYETKVVNLGPDPACDVKLSQTVSSGQLVGPLGLCAPTLSGALCSVAGALPPGEAVTIATTFQLPDVLPPGLVSSRAKVSSQTPDPNEANNEAMTDAEPCKVLLTIDKTDSPDPVAPGHAVTYDITVTNIGTVDAEDVIVKDIAPEELTKIRWCRGAACQPITHGPLVTKLNLPVGSSEIFRLRGIASACGTLLNEATAEHPLASPPTVKAVEETQVEGISLLCTGIDGSWTEGSLITKRFLLINCGPNIQSDNPGHEFTDTLPAGLTLVSVSADSGTPGMIGNTATWNGSVGVGDTVTIEVQATIDLGTLGMHLCNQAVLSADLDGDGINETSIPSDAPNLPGEADPCCIHVLTVIPTLSKEALLVLILLLVFLTLRRLRAVR